MINTWEKWWMKNAGVDFLRSDKQLRHPIRRKMLDTALMFDVKSVLEVGCATCVDYPLYRDAALSYVGVDITEKMVERARQFNPGVNVQQGTIYDLPFKDGEFDVCYVKDVLEHLPYPGAEKVDYRDAVREMWRVSGKLIMIGFFLPPACRESYLYKNGVYMNLYQRGEVEEVIRSLPGFNRLDILNGFGENQSSLYIATKKQAENPT